MTRAPADVNLGSLYQHMDSLTQAHSRDEAIAACFTLIETLFQPRSAQVAWYQHDAPHLLGAQPSAALRAPNAEALAQLGAGALALDSACAQPATVYAPLRVRGALVGWLFLEQPEWHAESAALLTALAAQVAPTLALLEADTRHAERVTQLHTLTEVGRVISGVLHLDTLLDAIYHAACQVVHVSDFYLALYDDRTDRLEFAYVVRASKRIQLNGTWRSNEGLTGVLVAQRAPIYTDDYAAECERRGIAPRLVGDSMVAHAWIGIPLFANDRLIGTMNVSSQRPDYTYSPEQVGLLVTIGAQATVAIENARLYQRSERQTRQLATLNRIGRTITSSLDPARVPSLIMEQVGELLNVEEGSLLLMDDSGDLTFAYTNGPVGDRLLGTRVPRGAGIAGYVAASGDPVVVNDVQHDTRFYATTDLSTGFTTRSLMAVPLRGVAGVQGVIEVLNKRDDGRFTGDDQRLLEAIADQAVIALENAKRFAQVDMALARRAKELALTNDQLEHNLRSLTALNALGLAISTSLRKAEEIFGMTARGIMEITNALGATVLTLDGDQLRVTVQIGPSLPLAEVEPLVRQTFETRRPEAIMRAQPPARALFVVPLLTTTQLVLGALCVYYAEALPNASDQETTVLFATQAAAAVGSLELFTAVRDARDKMASILASTRDGVMLIAPNGQIVITNDALNRLCALSQTQTQQISTTDFVRRWEQRAEYAPDDWAALRSGLAAVVEGNAQFATGELDPFSPNARAIEWVALPVSASGASQGGALLVLRDISDAKDAERLRQDLTNMIVHDLRSPLSSVMAAIDLLIKGISGEINVTQRGVLNIAYTSAVQMLEMINTLLDISRLEDGRMPLNCKPNALAPLVGRAIERLLPLAQDRLITILPNILTDLPLVFADADLIVRVVQNLLGNALKFSSRGSRVEITVQTMPRAVPLHNGAHTLVLDDAADAPLVCVAVRDHGIGIAPKDQDKIFTKFGQVGEQRGGTGLGLTFCKLVVEAHDGTIWIESAPGQGSTFFFTLPQAVASELILDTRNDASLSEPLSRRS